MRLLAPESDCYIGTTTQRNATHGWYKRTLSFDMISISIMFVLISTINSNTNLYKWGTLQVENDVLSLRAFTSSSKWIIISRIAFLCFSKYCCLVFCHLCFGWVERTRSRKNLDIALLTSDLSQFKSIGNISQRVPLTF